MLLNGMPNFIGILDPVLLLLLFLDFTTPYIMFVVSITPITSLYSLKKNENYNFFFF
jgi:hypothetical protein